MVGCIVEREYIVVKCNINVCVIILISSCVNLIIRTGSHPFKHTPCRVDEGGFLLASHNRAGASSSAPRPARLARAARGNAPHGKEKVRGRRTAC